MLTRPCGLVVLLTDFGVEDPYVGLVKGMVKRSGPKVEIIDLCHAVPPQNIEVGALFLEAAVGRFPNGTVFACVVDPEVGGERRILAAHGSSCYWLAPDNGLLTPILGDGAEVRAVSCEHLGLVPESVTFHGRDLFAPVAGALAAGRYGFGALGPRITDPICLVRRAGPPRVVHVDRFGNLLTDVTEARAAGVGAVRIGERLIPRRERYGATAPDSLLCLISSYGLLEIAAAGGSAAEVLGVGVGTEFELVESEEHR